MQLNIRAADPRRFAKSAILLNCLVVLIAGSYFYLGLNRLFKEAFRERGGGGVAEWPCSVLHGVCG